MESNYPKVPHISCYHAQIQENKEKRGGDFMAITQASQELCDLCEAWQVFFTKQYADLLAV